MLGLLPAKGAIGLRLHPIRNCGSRRPGVPASCLALAVMGAASPVALAAGGDARPLRIVRLKGKVCPTGPLVPIRAPDRDEAWLTHPDAAIPWGENTFGINDAGIVVGSLGYPDDPCADLDPLQTTEPHAFVRAPRPGPSMGLPSSLVALQAIDLHLAAGLAASERSTLNDISASGRYAVGMHGPDFPLDGRAWLCDLATLAGTGSAATVVDHDLSSAIVGSVLPNPDPMGGANAVWHNAGDPAPFITGWTDAQCAAGGRTWGFILRWGLWGNAQMLAPSIEGMSVGTFAASSGRDLTPAPPSLGDGIMAVGLEWSFDTAPLLFPLPNPCGDVISFLNCTHYERSAVDWREPFDDEAEQGLPDDGLPWDQSDERTPSVDPQPYPEGPMGEHPMPPGDEAIGANGVGEWCGMMWRVAHPELGISDCLRRAVFYWSDVAATCPDLVCVADLDMDSGYSALEAFAQSRAQCLSQGTELRDWLLVAGEDITTPLPRAVVYCGFGHTWSRQYLDELVRFDDVSEFNGYKFDYALSDNPNLSRITFVHDMNAYGQAVVTLMLAGAATGGTQIEYPCVLTLATDFDGNFRVDSRDVTAMTQAWATSAPLYDLDGDGSVGGADLAILMGDYAPNNPCDIHRAFACGSAMQGEAAQSGQVEELEMPDMLLTGVNALGFATLDDFAAWAATAEDSAVESAVEVLGVLTGGGM